MIKVLVVGAGSIGERHIRCMQLTGRAEVGVCELNAALCNQVTDRYALSSSFNDLGSAMSNRWDAAVIAAPAHLHVPLAQRLADAGIPVLVEKPLSVTFDGIDALIETIERRKLVAAVAYVHRAHPMLAAFRNALKSGRFGLPLQFIVQAGQHFPTHRPAYRTIYYADRTKGGGAVQDALSHLLDIGLWLVGPIDRLACDVAHQNLEGVEVEDTVNLICRHGRVLGSYTLNQYQAPAETSITIACERGTLRYELHASQWLWATEPGGKWNVESFPPVDRDAWFTRQEHAFLDAVEGVAEPLCSLSEGLLTLRATNAALAASERGLTMIAPC
jgi:predicted dehydrogenase